MDMAERGPAGVLRQPPFSPFLSPEGKTPEMERKKKKKRKGKKKKRGKESHSYFTSSPP